MRWPWQKQPREELHLGDVRLEIRPGTPRLIISRCASRPFEVFFEDDGDTGYIYACTVGDTDPIQDAVLVYQAAPKTPVVLQMKWCRKRPRVAVAVNHMVQAVVAFDEHRIWCRSGFPPGGMKWTEHPHTWSEEALEGF